MFAEKFLNAVKTRLKPFNFGSSSDSLGISLSDVAIGWPEGEVYFGTRLIYQQKR